MVLCDRCGTRMPAVRATIDAKIGQVYKGLDLTLECFPADDVPDDPDAFKKVRGAAGAAAWAVYGAHAAAAGAARLHGLPHAHGGPAARMQQRPGRGRTPDPDDPLPALPRVQALATMSPGDAAIIFTPDDSHYGIAAACVAAGLHVLVAKPLVRTLEHHRALVAVAEEAGVMVRAGWAGRDRQAAAPLNHPAGCEASGSLFPLGPTGAHAPGGLTAPPHPQPLPPSSRPSPLHHPPAGRGVPQAV
jgi:hypothetical protein